MLTVVLLLVAVGAVSAYADVSLVFDSFGVYDYTYFGLAAGCTFASFLVNGARFRHFLGRAGVSVRYGEALLVYLSGLSLTVTPAKVGELFKCFLLLWTKEAPISTTMPVLLLERATDLIALLMLSALGAGMLPHGGWGALGLLVVAVFVAAVLLSNRFAVRMIRMLGKLPLLGRKAPTLARLMGSILSLSKPGVVIRGCVLAVASWLCQVVALEVIVLGWGHGGMAFSSAAFIYCAPLIAGAVALVPGGVGVTELGMIRLLEHEATLHWMTPATAAATALLLRAATLWFAVGLGSGAAIVHRLLSNWTARPQTKVEAELS